MPQAAPIPRVARDRRDDSYETGHPTPGKRAGAGYVVSVEDDTCTVKMFDEDVTGVIYLGEPPVVGSVVEVEARGDLLVIPLWFEAAPGWLELPPVVRVMVPAGMTTVAGAGGFAPVSQEYGLWNMRLMIYTINGPVFNPVNVFSIPDAWACAWNHAIHGDGAGPDGNAAYWNNPYTLNNWSGSAVCEPLQPAVNVGAAAPVGSVVGAGWQATTLLSGGADTLSVRTRALSLWMNITEVRNRHLNLTRNGGLPDPVPPPGYMIEWESGNATLAKVEAAPTESTTSAATNAGLVYLRQLHPPFTEFGPASDTSNATWSEGRNVVCSGGTESIHCSIVPGYSGGVAAWTDVTNKVKPTGRSWFMFISDVLHDGIQHWNTGRVPGDNINQFRYNIHVAWRYTVKPSRYRFVKIP